MNLILLCASGVIGIAVLWLAQTLLLAAAGKPALAPPLRHRSEDSLVRWGMKFALQGVLIGFLFGFPALIGEDPIEYHRTRLQPASLALLFAVMAGAVFMMLPMFTVDVACGWVRIMTRYSALKSTKKVVRSILTPLPLAFVEEAIFRGIILAQLLAAMPGALGRVFAIMLSAALFAAVHFLRPQKRIVLPAVGLFGLGVILGIAYVIGGNSYWLPIGIHAGGVLFIQVCRPFVEYRGPAWLVGYSSYPICGLFGVLSMAIYVTGLSVLIPR